MKARENQVLLFWSHWKTADMTLSLEQCSQTWLRTRIIKGALKNSEVQATSHTNESTISGGGTQGSVFFKGPKVNPVCRQV